MLKKLRSDLSTFNDVSLMGGMNILLADQAKDSEETESTNGLGKSTFVRIVHFCLGSDFSREKVLDHPELKNVTFYLDFEWRGADYTVARNTSRDKHVHISSDFLNELDIDSKSKGDGFSEIALDDWKDALAERFYPETTIGKKRHAPSFRDIAIYLCRLGKAAYADPQTAFQNQSGAAKRLCVSFLLQLNWLKQREMEAESQKRDQNTAALKALKAAEENFEILSIGDLEAERVALELVLRTKKDEVEKFNVRSDYADLEVGLNQVDRSIHDLINENFSEMRLLDFYRDSAREAPEANPERPLAILRDAGAIFKEEALRTIDEISAFHMSVYRNRREFLKSEIARLAEEIGRRKAQIDRLVARKGQLLQTLNSSGAIDTLIELQRGYTELVVQHEILISKINERKKFDRRDDELSAAIAKIRRTLKSDLEDRRQAVDEVRALFAEFTSVLYKVPGRLSVDVAQAGYRFSFVIDREGSDGVGQMVIFCFDLAVACLWARSKAGLGVLIHDSTLFADVDPRQISSALSLAKKKSEEFGFQYICCLNSGSTSNEHFKNFDIDPFVRLRLTDDSPKGRLLGKQLRPRERHDLHN
ncbi:MAG: DUF2326 domain-containing protein [Candidatus Paceibacterota bacterium]|jgi:uncharacterized protein YydD (DUF2326 family)